MLVFGVLVIFGGLFIVVFGVVVVFVDVVCGCCGCGCCDCHCGCCYGCQAVAVVMAFCSYC